MTPKNIILAIVIVACLVISAGRFFGGSRGGDAKRRDLANELAAWVAKEASAGAKGRLLILAPVEETRDVFARQLARRLESQMRGAGFDPVEIERVPFSRQIETTGEPVERARFVELLRAHPECAVVVSLVGIPPLTEAELPAAGRPRIIVASSVLMPHLKTLPPGLIDFAIEVKQNRDDPRTDPALGELSKYFVLYRPK